jgi:hypothetical protein
MWAQSRHVAGAFVLRPPILVRSLQVDHVAIGGRVAALAVVAMLACYQAFALKAAHAPPNRPLAQARYFGDSFL